MVRKIATLLAFFLLMICSTAGQEKQTAPKLVAVPTYSESPEGLRHLLEDIFSAAEKGEIERSTALIENLILPNHRAWLTKVFGEKDGPAMADAYDRRLPDYVARLSTFFVEMAKKKDWELEIEQMKDMQDANEHRVKKALRVSLREPVVFYIANCINPVISSGPNIGYFVYLDGQFRHIDVGVLSTLSSLQPSPAIGGLAGPGRIRMGGKIMQERLINKQSPVYPKEALEQRLQGTVRLEILVSREGTVTEVKLLSGNPLLVASAIEAVRAWRYKPISLNGQPVEVVTTVDIVFNLRQ